MRKLAILIILIFPTFLMADNYTYSNVSPKIERLQGVILFPVEIEQIVIDHGDGPDQQYKYKLLRIRDEGQSVHQDRKKWVEENKKLMFEYAYGDLETVVDAIEQDKVAELKVAADEKLSKIKELITGVKEF